MAIWRLLEPLLLLLILIFTFTQVVLPPFIGKPFFWIFRKAEKNLRDKETELLDARTVKDTRRIEREIKKTNKS